jgi:hypothetical protein
MIRTFDLLCKGSFMTIKPLPHPMSKWSKEDQELAKQLIGLVLDHPNHRVTAQRQKHPTSDHVFHYWVVLNDAGDPPSFPLPISGRKDILRTLVNIEMAKPVEPNGGAVRFTDMGIAWFVRETKPTSAEIQKHLMMALSNNFRAHRDSQDLNPIYLNEVAEKIGITVTELIDEAYVLKQMGMPRHSKYVPCQIENGGMAITKEGITWVNDGFPDRNSMMMVNINVNVHVDIMTAIQEVRSAPDVDPALKLQWEALMHRLEEELDKPKGQGSFETVKEAVEMANSSRQLLGVTIPFLYRHWDKIQSLIDLGSSATRHI